MRWGDFVKMCARRNITLSPQKTKIGFTKATFYGHEVDKDGHRQTEHNLDPIKKCAQPENTDGLRSVLGMFVQGKNRVPEYAVKTAVLHALLRKGAQWQWRADVEGKAFETVRAALLERPVLCKPDYKAQFFLQTDASDDGKGAVLWQKGKDGARRIIAWYSKAWNASQRARPVFYREAEALFWGIERKQSTTLGELRRAARLRDGPATVAMGGSVTLRREQSANGEPRRPPA